MKSKIIHIANVEINHPDLHDYPEFAAKLKKILRIALGNALDYPYMITQKFNDQVTDTLRQLNKLNIRYAVFWSDGSWPNGAEFESELEKCIEEWNKTDWLAAGHILAFPEKLPKWHQQCVVINVEQFMRLGVNSIDGFWKHYPNYSQSKKHHHDNYTPHWIGPFSTSDGDDVTVEIHKNDEPEFVPDFLLDTLFPYAIENGMMIYNFPQSLRDTKKCCYPEDETEQTVKWFLNKSFPHNLTQEEIKHYALNLINEDKKCLKEFKIMDTEIVYITNTESVPGVVDVGAEVISVPCSGLHQFRYASNNLKTLKRIVWADFSPLGIAWTEKLLKDWDGRNFDQYYQENEEWLRVISLAYSKRPETLKLMYDPELVNEFVAAYGGEDEWVKVWNQIQNLQHDFVRVDLMKDWQKLVDVIGENQCLFLQLSNIWQYEINYINNDIIDAELAFGNLIKNLMINNNDVYFTGDTPADNHYEYTNIKILAEII